ncbi:MAG: CheR family methyltransferase [Methylobacter sp.]
MQSNLSALLLSRLSEFVAMHTGLHFPQARWCDLQRGIAGAAHELEFSNAESYADLLLSAPPARAMIQILASHLTVGETYFFREHRSLEILEEYILPELLHSRCGFKQHLRIWSAACCTGEEPYSIAMLLDRLIPASGEWDVSILATDITPRFLQKAANALYSEWSFRGTPTWIRDRHFNKRKDGRFELHQKIREKVSFSYLNLVEEGYSLPEENITAMDVIFCRNVLMYFTPEQAKKVVERLYHSLADEGWLIVSPTEASNALFSSFTPVEFPGAVLYRKIAHSAPEVSTTESPIPLSAALPDFLSAIELLPTVAPLILPEPALLLAHPDITVLSQPDDCESFSRIARNCANQGKLAEAVEWCEKAIAVDKLNPSHCYLLATIRQEQGEKEIAMQLLMRAVYLDPDFILAHFALGNMHLSHGRYRKAERYFNKVLKLLHTYSQEEILPESEGLTAGRLEEIVAVMQLNLSRQTILPESKAV